jgi:hypothetical protein
MSYFTPGCGRTYSGTKLVGTSTRRLGSSNARDTTSCPSFDVTQLRKRVAALGWGGFFSMATVLNPPKRLPGPSLGNNPHERKAFFSVALDHRLHGGQHDRVRTTSSPFGNLAVLAGERYLLSLVQLHNEFFAKLFDQIAPDGLTGATDTGVKAADLAFPFRLKEIFPRSDLDDVSPPTIPAGRRGTDGLVQRC